MTTDFKNEVRDKVATYSIAQIFSYTGVSKIRIAFQIVHYIVRNALGFHTAIARVNNYRMKLDFKTPGLSKVLFVYGTRELPDTYVLQNTLKEGMVMADIGANIGYQTIMAAVAVGETGHVYAFEPDPRNIPLLKENVTLNDFDNRITVYEKAVSDHAGRKQFQLGERSNVSSFVDRPDVIDSVEVECVALHEFEHIDQVDMLRMDAEGYECKIIDGVIPYLKTTDRPFKIMLEVHPEEYNDTDLNFKATLESLFALGFTVSRSIAGTNFKTAYGERGYESVGHWVETKHPRELFVDIKNEDVLDFIDKRMIRAMLIERT